MSASHNTVSEFVTEALPPPAATSKLQRPATSVLSASHTTATPCDIDAVGMAHKAIG
eukprot:CAMPEP_0183544316 /NCGR_PEP_ID=MMETSP0371-20130417/47254_1 /TAXON_ID=268820 /ORGANISM="Peridinium aciculiferum, Strain PAER-2" /LENGTH=56 /DNA_ID=CAMNT_0025746057 /DNA_START=11 /DNA_END=181 /DNA_ORIENTATION=+